VGKFKFRWLKNAENDLRELKEKRLRRKANNGIGICRKGEQGPERTKEPRSNQVKWIYS
jgi:hypothetical protein